MNVLDVKRTQSAINVKDVYLFSSGIGFYFYVLLMYYFATYLLQIVIYLMHDLSILQVFSGIL